MEFLYESERSEQQCYYELSIILPDCSSPTTMAVAELQWNCRMATAFLAALKEKLTIKKLSVYRVTLSRAALPIMVGLNGLHPALAQYGGLYARDLFSSYKAMSNHARQIVDHLSAINEVLFYTELELRELPTLSGHASLTSLAEEGMCQAHDIGDDVQTSGRRRSSAARG
ncbi:hypothetical protein MRX96_025851 [Rhipicephalus microplus]